MDTFDEIISSHNQTTPTAEERRQQAIVDLENYRKRQLLQSVPTTHKKPPKSTGYVKKSKPKDRLTQQGVAKVLLEERGLLQPATLRLGVSRKQLEHYISTHAAVAHVLVEAREGMGDVAERQLYNLIEAGDRQSIMYYLTTVHRKRGYGLRDSDTPANNSQVFVGAINVVAIPPGQFLTKEEAAQYIVDIPAPT